MNLHRNRIFRHEEHPRMAWIYCRLRELSKAGWVRWGGGMDAAGRERRPPQRTHPAYPRSPLCWPGCCLAGAGRRPADPHRPCGSGR
jgi:hypothetical protein